MQSKLKDLLNYQSELKNEISFLKEKHLNEDDPEQEELWNTQVKSKEIILKDVSENIRKLQHNIKQKFIHNIHKKRSKHSFSSNIFRLAQKDAEDFVFNYIIILPPEIIAEYFSTSSHILTHTNGPVCPSKLSYKWYHDLKNPDDNIIPLSDHIEIPQKRNDNGSFTPITFFISYFYNNKNFIQRCKDFYYNKHHIHFFIQQDRKIKHKRYWITLNIDKDGILIF